MSYAHSLTIHPCVAFWAFAPREAHRCLKRPRSFKPLHSKSSFLARGLFQGTYLMSFVFCDLAGLLAKRSASRFGKMCDCPLLFFFFAAAAAFLIFFLAAVRCFAVANETLHAGGWMHHSCFGWCS